MSRLISLVIALACFLPAGLAQVPTTQYSAPEPGKQVAQRAVGFDYWLYLPQAYEEQEQWPLVIFLHGAGAKDLGNAITNGTVAGRVAGGTHFPFVLVSPYYNNKWWSSEELIVFVDAVAARYKVDLRRVYITGLSMGGYGTWELASRYPDRFAAALPICGGGTPSLAPRMKEIPTWAFHGALDGTVPMTESQKMVDALKAAGGEVQFTVLPKAAHVCWPEVYRKPEVYEWLLSHTKATPAAIDRQAELGYALREDVRWDFRPLMAEGSTVGKLTTELTVANSLESPIEVSGSLAGGAVEVTPATFQVSVAPGAKETVSFAIVGDAVQLESSPTIEAKWKTTVRAAGKPELTLDSKRVLPINALYTCARASGELKVDGDLEEWSGPWVEIPPAGRDNPLRASMAVAHDDRGVYVAVRVTDAVVKASADKAVWDQDGLEVRLDFRQVPRQGSFRDWREVLPVLVSPTESAMSPVLWQPKDLPEGTVVASRRTATGYETEIAVPMSYIQTKLAGAALEQFRVNVCVNDAGGSRQGVMKNWWHPDWRREQSDSGAGTFRCE